MLTLYRRHTKTCGQPDRYYRRCKCPVWVEGTKDDGQYVRLSLKLSSWERAEDRKRELEAGSPYLATSAAMNSPKCTSVREATAKFFAECEARNLSEATLRKYRLLIKLTNEFADAHLVDLRTFDVERVREFRKSWKDGPRASGKKLERLRAFFKFCVENKWIEASPAVTLRAPLVKDKPTMPFTRDEMARILEKAGYSLAFILTLRYTGMRISDAAMLRADGLRGNRVFLYTQKTGVPVYVPIPDSLTNLLAGLNPVAGYLFLRGESTRLDTCTDLWRRQLARVFKNAEISNGHPHRFRDTFAVELLQSGVPIEHVSILLGHSSIKVTEKHYSPWVKTRQDILEEEVRRTWEQQHKPRLVKG